MSFAHQLPLNQIERVKIKQWPKINQNRNIHETE